MVDFSKYPLPKRIRHHTAANLYFPKNQIKLEEDDYYPPIFEKINWGNYYQNSLPPNCIDIGCGKGFFLLTMAESFPHKNFLGIELRKILVDWLQNIIEGEKITNCCVLWYSASNGFPFIEDNSIEEIYYLFPDPWHKNKHIKRRLFNEIFLKEINRILKPDGKFYISTDVEKVHKYHIALLKRNNWFFNEINNDSEWNLPQTNKEKFCIENNIPYYRIIGIKKS